MPLATIDATRHYRQLPSGYKLTKAPHHHHHTPSHRIRTQKRGPRTTHSIIKLPNHSPKPHKNKKQNKKKRTLPAQPDMQTHTAAVPPPPSARSQPSRASIQSKAKQSKHINTPLPQPPTTTFRQRRTCAPEKWINEDELEKRLEKRRMDLIVEPW